jgi:hypothetical protein
MIEYKINDKAVRNLIKNFIKIGGEGKQFFDLLGIKIDQMTQLTFRVLGARSGMPSWRKLSLLTLHPSWKAKKSAYPEYNGKRYNDMRWNHRYGTDGASSRMYSEKSNSNILQASGEFKRSFGIMKSTNKSLRYGTNHEKKGVIGIDRPVLFVTADDRSIIGRMFMIFIRQKIGQTT